LAEPDAGGDEARTLRPMQVAADTHSIAFGPRADQKDLSLRGAILRESTSHQPLCADIDWFSLHAHVRVGAHDRKRLEQLCRYSTRLELPGERVQLNPAGPVEPKLKTLWRDGTTHLPMSPLEFMQRLAVLVPQGPPAQSEAATEAAVAPKWKDLTSEARPHRISRARLLNHVVDNDVERCSNCGGIELKILAAIHERATLTHLGLNPQPPLRGASAQGGTGRWQVS
jgi:hypothetical protein